MAQAIELEIVLEPDEESDWITVSCPSLKGCVSQGRTEEETLENIKEAILLWLEVDIEQHAAKLDVPQVAQQVTAETAFTRKLALSF